MAGSDRNSAEAWKQWLDAQFARRTGLKQQDFAAAIGVGNSAVSKWRKGTNAPDVDAAIDAAAFFDRPAQEALRAAGHTKPADLLDKASPAGAPSDPFAEEIMSWTHLAVGVREALLQQYLAKRAADMEQTRTLATQLRNVGGEDVA